MASLACDGLRLMGLGSSKNGIVVDLGARQIVSHLMMIGYG